MKKYIAPLVQITALTEAESLLLGVSDPDKTVSASTPDGDIPVAGGSGGGPTPPPGNVDYAKQFDSWDAWDE